MKIKLTLGFVTMLGIITFSTTLLNHTKNSAYSMTHFKNAYDLKNKDKSLVEFDGVIEPPIPSSEGHLIFGIDSNHNEVRDDVEIWINRTYFKKNERMVARQFAMDLTYQLRATHENNKDRIAHSVSVLMTTAECISFIFGGDKSLEIIDTLTDLVFNTKDRLSTLENMRHFTFSSQFTVQGMTVGEAWKGCNFEIDDKSKLMNKYLHQYK